MIPTVLTIAGSDSCGGAGIQADLKTFTALGAYGMSAITALTAQNTTGVRCVLEVRPDFVAAQIDAVAEDIGIDAAKTGMLATRAIIEAVADRVAAHKVRPLVVDPVMVAQSGATLLAPDAVSAVVALMLPLAAVATPNLPEAQRLCGVEVRNEDDMVEAAKRIRDMGPQWVLVKGGHLAAAGAGQGGAMVDVLFGGQEVRYIRRPRIATADTHGTGCTYAAAIATGLAFGMPVPGAVDWARDALQVGLAGALRLGAGSGPLDHTRLVAMRRPRQGG